LAKAVREADAGEGGRYYPGSPWLIARALRARDRYLAFELRAEEHAVLARVLRGKPNAESRCADGFAAARGAAPARGPAFVLIDPPFERADAYERTARTVRAVLSRNRQATVMIWLPLKDLATFDGFLRDLEDAAGGAPVLVAEARLRPLSDPMKMNGCALAFVRPPKGLEASLQAICGWVAGRLGENGAAGRIWTAS
jgi:23S rRNA (adenine2030-N6)-methyltransferase